MSRYIDLNELSMRVEDSNKSAGLHAEDYRKIKKWMRESPSIDIVRCGECKHMTAEGRCLEFADDNLRPSISDFCSYGEREGE